jgi:Na+-transporting NADH:ubiquinone oxidoreductase subunit C
MPEEANTSTSPPNEGIGKILLVALSLCVVCSVIVSTTAVTLKPLQDANKVLDRKRNILLAAGLLREGEDIETLFKQVETKLVDLDTGTYVEGIDATTYDQRAAAKAPDTGIAIPPEADIAKIRRRAKYAPVYLVHDNTGLRSIILPVHGYGLYSTLYGYIALAGDGNTVQGLRFYEQGETPGLGGEVQNPVWLSKWQDKRVYDENGQVRLALVKGTVDPANPDAVYQVDALSGATMTSRGVTNLIRYWLGKDGFEPFLKKVRTQRG